MAARICYIVGRNSPRNTPVTRNLVEDTTVVDNFPNMGTPHRHRRIIEDCFRQLIVVVRPTGHVGPVAHDW